MNHNERLRTKNTRSTSRVRQHRHELELMFWLRDLFAETGASREDEQPMIAFGKHPDMPPVFPGVQCEGCDLLILARRNDLFVEH